MISTPSVPTFVLAASLLGGLLAAQTPLSGTYTIDPNGSGARNYATFTAASAALKANGVNAPVQFNVANGTFTESWTIPVFAGASATTKVTFKAVAIPPTVYLTQLVGGAGNIITLEEGTQFVVIDGFDFVSTTTGLAITGTVTTNTTPISDIEIANCRFGQNIAGDANRRGHIYIEGRNICTRWHIHHCEFNFGAYNYAWYMSQVTRFLVEHNEFKLNGTLYGMYWINTNNSFNVITNNLFTGSTSTSTGACAIHVAASNINNDICFNTIDISTPGVAVRTFGTSGNFNRIYGNVIVVTGTGYGLSVEIASLNYWMSDGNLYHIQSGIIGHIAGATGTPFNGLAAWRTATAGTPNGTQDQNSIQGDPLFVSATDRHLKPASPAIGKAVLFSGRHDPLIDRDRWVRGSKQDMGAYELTGWKNYGTGCPGTGSKVPTLSIGGNVAPGENITINLGDARANAVAVLSAGAPSASIPLGGSCNLLHNPLLLFFLMTNASGTLSVPANIPASTTIAGVSGFLQFAVDDPASPPGFTVTSGADARL